MAEKLCKHCFYSYPEQLFTCPYCGKSAAQAEDEIETLSEDDILDVLSEDQIAEDVPSGAMVLDEDSDELLIIQGEETGQLEEVVDEEIRELIETPPKPPKATEEPTRSKPSPPAASAKPPAAPAKKDKPFGFVEKRKPRKPMEPGKPAPAAPQQPEDPKKTSLRKIAPTTKLAEESELRKMIEEAEAQAGAEERTPRKPMDPKQTKLRKVSPSTKLASDEDLQSELEAKGPHKPMDPKRTKLRKVSQPTKLAGDDDMRKEVEAGSADPKKTKLRKQGQETRLATDEDVERELSKPDAKTTKLRRTPSETKLAMRHELLREMEDEDAPKKTKLRKIAHETQLRQQRAETTLASEDEMRAEVGAGDKPISEVRPEDMVDLGAPLEGEIPLPMSSTTMIVDRNDLIDEEPEEVSPDDLVGDDTPEIAEEAPEGERRDAPHALYGPPKYGRRWVAGTILGMFLAALAGSGTWYVKPELVIESLRHHPDHELSDGITLRALQARDLMDQGQQNKALELLPDSGGARSEIAARGEARWLKGDIDAALRDLQRVNPNLAKQVKAAVESNARQEQIDKAKDVLVKANILPANDDRLKNLPGAVGEAVKATNQAMRMKQQYENQIDTLVAILVKHGVAVDRKQLAKSFEAGIMDLKEDQKTVAHLNGQVGAKDRVELPKKVAFLQKRKGDLEDVNTELAKAKVQQKDRQGVIELAKNRDQLNSDLGNLRVDAKKTLRELNDDKDVKVNPPSKLGELLFEYAKIMRDKAKAPIVTAVAELVGTLGAMGDGSGQMFRDATKVAGANQQLLFYMLREPLVITPEVRIDTWLAMFHDRAQKNPAQIKQAGRDAHWVLSPDSKSDMAQQGKANYLLGLIQRNQGDFIEARKKLAKAFNAASAAKPKPVWTPLVERTLQELREPHLYYLPTAEKWYKTGQKQLALETVNTGLKAIPGAPRLLALRALLHLETAADHTVLKDRETAIRKDAGDATQDPAAKGRGYYVLGRLEESLKDFGKAESLYKAAIKHTPADRKEERTRYYIALNRILLRAQRTVPSRGVQVVQAITAEPVAVRGRIQAMPLGLSLLVGFTGDDDLDLPASERQRLSKLIAEVRVRLKDEDPKKADRLGVLLKAVEFNLFTQGLPKKLRGQGYMILGKSLSNVGMRNDGLKVYLQGMKLFSGDVTVDQLTKLVQSHPAFRITDTAQHNPSKADFHFGQGQHLFWNNKYADAEKQFRLAIVYNRVDAAMHYFLGLSLLLQKDRKKREDAEFHFARGASLEAQNQPSPEEVNLRLERLQGSLRQTLNEYRREAALQAIQQ